MVDNISIEAKIEPIYNVTSIAPFSYKNLWFNPLFVRGKEDIIKGFESEYKGLRVLISLSGKITISNSIHKFLKGNNHSDFSHSELIIAIDKIASFFEINPLNWKITRLEFGLNIETPKEAVEYLNCLASFKDREFDKMKNNHKCYGKKCDMSEYSIKFYDKTLHNHLMDGGSLNTNLLRIEVCYKQKRKLPKEIKTLQDLKNLDCIKLLYDSFIEILEKTEYAEEIDFSVSTFEERVLYFASMSPNFLAVEKR